MLCDVAFSGRHAEQSVWILTRKCNSIPKDQREQARRVALFLQCKYWFSVDDYLRENDETNVPRFDS